jgi:hypothetical protein
LPLGVEKEGSKGARIMYEKEIEVKARELPEHLSHIVQLKKGRVLTERG